MMSKSSKKPPTISPERFINGWLPSCLRPRRQPTEAPRHLKVGVWGEAMAEAALQRKGYRTLGRRVRVGSHGEIDLIMQKDDILIFIEVRTRADESFGRPASTLNYRKKRALSRAARRYLLRLKERPDYYRFDIVEVIGSPEYSQAPLIRHIEAALVISPAPISLGNTGTPHGRR